MSWVIQNQDHYWYDFLLFCKYQLLICSYACNFKFTDIEIFYFFISTSLFSIFLLSVNWYKSIKTDSVHCQHIWSFWKRLICFASETTDWPVMRLLGVYHVCVWVLFVYTFAGIPGNQFEVTGDRLSKWGKISQQR